MTRPVELVYITQQRKAADAKREVHRLRYVYFMDRLEDVARMPAEKRAEIAVETREIARECRAERAAYLGTTQAESDAQHGTVIEVAKTLSGLRVRP